MLRPTIEDIIKNLTSLVHWIEENKTGFISIAEGLGVAIVAVKLMTVEWEAMSVAMLANPYVLAAAGIASIAGAIAYFLNERAQLDKANLSANSQFAEERILGIYNDQVKTLTAIGKLKKDQIELNALATAKGTAGTELSEAKKNLEGFNATSDISKIGMQMFAGQGLSSIAQVKDVRKQLENEVGAKQAAMDAINKKAGTYLKGDKGAPAPPSAVETHNEHIVININKMIESFDLHTINLKEGAVEIKKIVVDLLQESVSSVKYIHN